MEPRKKWFTVEEANALLPYLERQLEQLQTLYRRRGKSSWR